MSKFRAFMKNPLPFLLVLAVSAVFASPAWAEKADRDKPMLLEAATMRLDDVKQVSTFTGNVVMTKGSILVRAAKIEVREAPEGYQFAVINGAPDKPAFFRQKREGLDEFIEVESEVIDYDGRADTVKFTGKAVLRRLRGATVADEISGAVIVYENLTDKFSVDGSPTTGGASVPGQRVRAMLTPKAEAPASAPKTPAAQPGPSLRSTTTLGSTPQ